MRKTVVAAATTLLLVCGLAGCSEEPAPAPLTLDGESSASGDSEPSEPSAAPETATSDEPVDGELLLGASAASTAEEKAAVDTWFAYWTELYRMYETTKPNRDDLYELASGDAAEGPLEYVGEMQAQKVRQRGGAIAAATSVDVSGDEAVVETCFRNTALNVTKKGVPVEELIVWFTTEDTLRKEGPDWRVTRSLNISRNGKCDFR